MEIAAFWEILIYYKKQNKTMNSSIAAIALLCLRDENKEMKKKAPVLVDGWFRDKVRLFAKNCFKILAVRIQT